MILLSDPQVINIPVQDCGEPLAEIASVPAIALDHRERDEARAYGRVRIGVLERLCSASGELPNGIRFLVIEGHRNSTEQARRFALQQDRLRRSGIIEACQAAGCRRAGRRAQLRVRAPHREPQSRILRPRR